MSLRFPFLCLLAFALRATGFAHDTWLETRSATVHAGDAVYVDYFLGNHGNDHRDFKVAGKANLADAAISVIAPDGTSFDLKPAFVDRGYAPKEGFWIARYEPAKPGLYLVAQTADQIVSYAPERVVRSAKVFFYASEHLDRIAPSQPGFDRVLGHPFELVAQMNPIAPMGPGVPIQVKLLFRGKPLANEKVSFIPMGETLAKDFDPTYERKTDAQGIASFEPKEANVYLVVAHHLVPEKGTGYEKINYSATLTLIVPAICPCCGE